MERSNTASAVGAASAETPLLATHGLRRTFGETVALASCSFDVRLGEIHALVGENGSGKSTLIKILSGILPPSAGQLSWDGAPARFRTPREAQHAGIATVYQETLVLEHLTVRDNVVLGLDPLFRRRLNVARERELVQGALATLGLDVHPETPVRALSLAQRQGITIARALLRPWRILVLDEATSALDIDARDQLFEALRGFRDEGRSILFISHRMDEIESLADRTTVLRSGNSVATLRAGEAPTHRLLELMSTREEVAAVEGELKPSAERGLGGPLLTMHGIATQPDAAPCDLAVHAGEIVGVAGLEGHGQVDFLECAVGLRPPSRGSVETLDGAIDSFLSSARRGVIYLPRDRKTEGVFAPLSVLDNLTLSALQRLSRLGLLRTRARRVEGERLIGETHVVARSLAAPIATLSGGNQQKVLIGRLLASHPRVLVLNDPMRGVDLGAKQDIYDILRRFAADGGGVLLLSTELSELCLLCDRVAVFHDNALIDILPRERLDAPALIAAMFGQTGKARA